VGLLRNCGRTQLNALLLKGWGDQAPKRMTELGKLLIVLGVVILIAGAVLLLLGRTNLPLGRLPGDIVYRGKHTTFYFPLATSIVVSVLLSVVLYVISRWRQ
jgi:hypothetical protein